MGKVTVYPAAGILPLYFILHTSYFILKVFKLLVQKSTYLTSFLVFLLMDGDPAAGILRMLPGSKVKNIEESCLEI